MSKVSTKEQPRRPWLEPVPKAAEVLGVSESHMYGMIAEGRVQGIIRIGRRIVVNMDALLAGQTATNDD